MLIMAKVIQMMKMWSFLQTLGFTPDFVQAAVAPFINDIHRKGVFLTSCLQQSFALMTSSGVLMSSSRRYSCGQ